MDYLDKLDIKPWIYNAWRSATPSECWQPATACRRLVGNQSTETATYPADQAFIPLPEGPRAHMMTRNYNEKLLAETVQQN